MLLPALAPVFDILAKVFPDPAAAQRHEVIQRLYDFIHDLIHGERAAIAQRSGADLGDSDLAAVLYT